VGVPSVSPFFEGRQSLMRQSNSLAAIIGNYGLAVAALTGCALARIVLAHITRAANCNRSAMMRG
jgi:ABC-type transport system involved in cytochrome c biogenesis permease subunit